MREIVRYVVLVLIVSMGTVTAQTVSNVTAVLEGKTIEITYDLDKAADISAWVSFDGGENYSKLRKVSGDVGKTVGPGHNTIVWNVLDELDEFFGDDIMFKVRVDGNAEALWRKVKKDEEKEREKEEKEQKAREEKAKEEMAKIEKAKEKEEREAKEKEAKAKEKEEKEQKAREERAKEEMAKIEKAKEKEEREAKEKEAKVKEKEEKEQETKEEKTPIPLHTFFTVNAAYGLTPLWSYGFKVGQYKTVGWYLSFMSNFHFKGINQPFMEGEFYNLSDRKTVRVSAQVGLVVHPCKPVSLLLGVGYGYHSLTYKTTDNMWYSYPRRTFHGVDASIGFLFHIKSFTFSVEVLTTNFRTSEVEAGIGFTLPNK